MIDLLELFARSDLNYLEIDEMKCQASQTKGRLPDFVDGKQETVLGLKRMKVVKESGRCATFTTLRKPQ
jgi:hypothetical protein